jgi:hypothetical protein
MSMHPRPTATLVAVVRVFGAPHEAAQPHARQRLIHQQIQLCSVLIIDADQHHAIFSQ